MARPVRLSFDASFLIDHQRERGGGGSGPAHRFLRTRPDAELFLSAVALGEFAEGVDDPENDPIVNEVRRSYVLIPIDERVAATYGTISRGLRRAGRLIGPNDVWIAACALRHGLPVVTANTEHFRRIDGLEVVSYRDDKALLS